MPSISPFRGETPASSASRPVDRSAPGSHSTPNLAPDWRPPLASRGLRARTEDNRWRLVGALRARLFQQLVRCISDGVVAGETDRLFQPAARGLFVALLGGASA